MPCTSVTAHSVSATQVLVGEGKQHPTLSTSVTAVLATHTGKQQHKQDSWEYFNHSTKI